jgi:hypothetical protein
MSEKECLKCWWLDNYGFDFIINYKKINVDTVCKFLNITEDVLKYNYKYKEIYKKIKELDHERKNISDEKSRQICSS